MKDVSQEFMMSSLSIDLRVGPFSDSLYARSPKTMGELQERAVGFMHIEEIRVFHKEQQDKAATSTDRKDRSLGKRQLGQEEKRVGLRPRDPPKGPRFHHYTPLNAPRARILKEALNTDLSLSNNLTPKNADGRKHCQYHQNLGHITEECTTF